MRKTKGHESLVQGTCHLYVTWYEPCNMLQVFLSSWQPGPATRTLRSKNKSFSATIGKGGAFLFASTDLDGKAFPAIAKKAKGSARLSSRETKKMVGMILSGAKGIVDASELAKVASSKIVSFTQFFA